ncbi:pilus assembly PilX family protein [Biformimicrobium ophioploci]|uniref:Type 4 fimbrial biogenesis protein PilX N-terminal domain-containing protein n=1 Tax=Biformimicrobium ophioploci TaxID=3036711 RepID=A0ABQ6M2K5_9GAMM|nr:PilX N-terminal domain-containing pilus assembly protein [Microbulbifer sp. NKW57]GMG88584.1 hypothetical protein MNKW57_29050 [Microbulbifer sp. NKW57]
MIVSLIILLILTLIGVSASKTVLLEEKMTFAARDAAVALQMAEMGARAAEAEISKMVTTTGFSATGAGGYYSEGSGPEDYTDTLTWGSANSQGTTVTVDGQEYRYRYFIEISGTASEDVNPGDINAGLGYGEDTGIGVIQVFRIVAMGEGLSTSTRRYITTHYGTRL